MISDSALKVLSFTLNERMNHWRVLGSDVTWPGFYSHLSYNLKNIPERDKDLRRHQSLRCPGESRMVAGMVAEAVEDGEK